MQNHAVQRGVLCIAKQCSWVQFKTVQYCVGQSNAVSRNTKLCSFAQFKTVQFCAVELTEQTDARLLSAPEQASIERQPKAKGDSGVASMSLCCVHPELYTMYTLYTLQCRTDTGDKPLPHYLLFAGGLLCLPIQLILLSPSPGGGMQSARGVHY